MIPIAAAAFLGLFLAACTSEPQLQRWYGQPRSDFAVLLQDLMSNIVMLAAVVFVVVEAALFYAIFRFRRRPNAPIPPQVHGHSMLEIGWTIAPAVVLAFVAIPTVRTIFLSYDPPTEPTVQVRVIAKQWWWEFQYPELGITTANEIHFPVGQTAQLTIESGDIIHGFWIPELGGKRDAIPLHSNTLWWTPSEPGYYYGQCTQLCGTSHANMRARAIVHTQEDWDAWVTSMQNASGQPSNEAQIQQGYQLITTRACVGCHTIQDTPLQAKVGPDLTRFGSRTTIGAGMYENTQENLTHWLMDPLDAKPGNKMPDVGLTEEEAAAIAAYLNSLK